MRDAVELLQRLQSAPGAFDFYAALRLLDCAHPDLPRIGQARRPQEEALRFGQQPSLAFEPAMLGGLVPAAREEEPGPREARLLVHGFGLLGANGALPTHLTEYLRDRERNAGDATPVRFLDILQHRMVSLLYRSWAASQPAVSLDRPQDDRFGVYAASLIGLGMPSLRGRDAVPDHAKLHYAGRLAPAPASADGLAAVLGDFFRMPVRVQEFVGHWMPLPTDGLCRLGAPGAASRLGQGSVIGRSVWSLQHKFRIVLGPLDQAQLQRMLPGGEGMRQLRDWVRQYAGLALDWDVNYVMQAQAVPRLKLGGAGAARLGWTSWVSSKAPQQDDRQLCVSPHRQPGQRPSPSPQPQPHGSHLNQSPQGAHHG